MREDQAQAIVGLLRAINLQLPCISVIIMISAHYIRSKL